MVTSHSHNFGFMVKHDRRAKAEKINIVLNEYFGHIVHRGKLLLDIGTGNGEIAGYLSEHYDVVSVDVIDQRTVCQGFRFVQISGEKLPFSDKSFDVVVSNHVIEHLTDVDRHLSEIWRVLKDDGLVYLATPNRFWPWEVHNRIFFLHYLPATIFKYILKRLELYHDDIFPLTWWALKCKVKKLFSVDILSDRISKWPLRYHMRCHPIAAKILSWIPLRFYRICTFINPTLVVVLKKDKR